MSAARYVVRLRDRSQYLQPAEADRCPQWWHDRKHAALFASAAKAREWISDLRRWYRGDCYSYRDARVVRLLSHKEAQDRKVATALREHAARCRSEAVVWAAMKSTSKVNVAHVEGIARGYEKAAEDAELAAEKLWKRRGK